MDNITKIEIAELFAELLDEEVVFTFGKCEGTVSPNTKKEMDLKMAREASLSYISNPNLDAADNILNKEIQRLEGRINDKMVEIDNVKKEVASIEKKSNMCVDILHDPSVSGEVKKTYVVKFNKLAQCKLELHPSHKIANLSLEIDEIKSKINTLISRIEELHDEKIRRMRKRYNIHDNTYNNIYIDDHTSRMFNRASRGVSDGVIHCRKI